jgi:hypothetical protein
MAAAIQTNIIEMAVVPLQLLSIAHIGRVVWAELLLRSVGRVAGACDAINKRIIYRGEKVMLQPNKLMVMKSGEKPLLGSILQLADRSIKKRNSIRNPFFF